MLEKRGAARLERIVGEKEYATSVIVREWVPGAAIGTRRSAVVEWVAWRGMWQSFKLSW